MAIVKPSTILEPFAINGDLVAPPATSSAIVANQDTGFPLLQSTPIALGGTPVNREQMNGVINLYSQFAFWQQCGGTYTFDSAISTQYGGYPAGIVLFCASNNSFQLSLTNNNTANFITTPSYINDGVHWKQITYPTPHGQSYITTNSTFTVPLGVTNIYITLKGAGGGGGAGYFVTTTQSSGGGGGGAGGVIFKSAHTVTPNETITITIGGGGIGGSGNGGTGGNGGNTIVSSTSLGTLIGYGGGGGNISGIGVGGLAGLPNGQYGGTGSTFVTTINPGTVISGGNGGNGLYGGGGCGGGQATAANMYGLYGGGGGGGGGYRSGFTQGGSGGSGFVIIEY